MAVVSSIKCHRFACLKVTDLADFSVYPRGLGLINDAVRWGKCTKNKKVGPNKYLLEEVAWPAIFRAILVETTNPVGMAKIVVFFDILLMSAFFL